MPAGGTPGARTTLEFRSWLRELRERAGLTQEELAAAVGTDRRNIRRWEIEGHDPSGTMLLRVLAAVGIEFAQALPSGVPGAITTELRELRREVSEGNEAEARRHEDVLARLDAQLDELRTLSSRLAETSARPE